MNLGLQEAAKKCEAEILAKKTDRELVDYVCDNVRGAAILNSRGRYVNAYDDKCGLALEEAKRRGKPELYDRGYKMAVRSFGYA